jgi:hypothetical protein
MVDKSDLILKAVENVHEELKEHKSESNKRFDKYNDQLEIHIKGTEANTILIKTNKEIQDAKIQKLERPQEFLKTLKTVVLYISAISGGVLIILKLLKG